MMRTSPHAHHHLLSILICFAKSRHEAVISVSTIAPAPMFFSFRTAKEILPCKSHTPSCGCNLVTWEMFSKRCMMCTSATINDISLHTRLSKTSVIKIKTTLLKQLRITYVKNATDLFQRWLFSKWSANSHSFFFFFVSDELRSLRSL